MPQPEQNQKEQNQKFRIDRVEMETISSEHRREAEIQALTLQLARRLRKLRREREWSLSDLSKASGVSRSMLSQIERGEVSPTLSVAFRVAKAFGMSLGELISDPEEPPGIEVIRADEEAYYFRRDESCSLRTLFPLRLEKDVEFYELKLTPGCALKSEPHLEGTREFVTVHKGRVRISSGNDHVELTRGDSAHYRADLPHVVENIGRGDAVVFLVAIYRR